jgi:hypothetical protein
VDVAGERAIREVLATETHPLAFSEKLFGPRGLFGKLARTEEERKALTQSPLFKEAQARLRVLQRSALVPLKHYAAPSAECTRLYANELYYGCIALTAAVAEAIVRDVWAAQGRQGRSGPQAFERMVADLHKKKLIPEEVRDKLEAIWANRNDFHHLSKTLEQNPARLQELAREKLTLLAEIERYFFGFRVVNGKLVLDHPEFWPAVDENALVCVRGAG